MATVADWRKELNWTLRLCMGMSLSGNKTAVYQDGWAGVNLWRQFYEWYCKV
jgi:hypothetical protein